MILMNRTIMAAGNYYVEELDSDEEIIYKPSPKEKIPGTMAKIVIMSDPALVERAKLSILPLKESSHVSIKYN